MIYEGFPKFVVNRAGPSKWDSNRTGLCSAEDLRLMMIRVEKSHKLHDPDEIRFIIIGEMYLYWNCCFWNSNFNHALMMMIHKSTLTHLYEWIDFYTLETTGS